MSVRVLRGAPTYVGTACSITRHGGQADAPRNSFNSQSAIEATATLGPTLRSHVRSDFSSSMSEEYGEEY